MKYSILRLALLMLTLWTSTLSALNPLPAGALSVASPDLVESPVAHKILFDSVMPTQVELTLDEELHAWMDRYTVENYCNLPADIVRCPDSVYQQRLRELPFIMEMAYNRTVRGFIERYVVHGRAQTANLLALSEYYFPIFEEYLSKYNLPLELKYLPIIESGLKTTIKSHAGAGGLWQFMVATGRMYGLEINSLVDERSDPIKATDAACRFLRDLYDIYGDWNLVIAAYNCGPGNVNKAIRRAGGKRDYWDIYSYIPRETRGYVPVFIGATYAMIYHEEHNICPRKLDLPHLTDTVMTSQRMHFKQIAAVLDMTLEEVRMLNPQYRQDVVPGVTKEYALCLPLDKATEFIDREQEIVAYDTDKLLTSQFARINAAQANRTDLWGTGDVMYHKVKSGDTLGHIARKYHVYVSQLKRWNNISGTTIRIGQRIKIYK